MSVNDPEWEYRFVRFQKSPHKGSAKTQSKFQNYFKDVSKSSKSLALPTLRALYHSSMRS